MNIMKSINNMKATSKQQWKTTLDLKEKGIYDHNLNSWLWKLSQQDDSKKTFSDLIEIIENSTKEEIMFYLKSLGYNN